MYFFNVLRGCLNTLLPFKVHPMSVQTREGSLTAASQLSRPASACASALATAVGVEMRPPDALRCRCLWSEAGSSIVTMSFVDPCLLLALNHTNSRCIQGVAHRLENRPAKPRLNSTVRSWGTPIYTPPLSGSPPPPSPTPGLPTIFTSAHRYWHYK